MSEKFHDKGVIRVLCQDGSQKEIHLKQGDITNWPATDPIDVLMVSAFPDNYDLVPKTLIWSLKQNLDIKVKEIAKDKAFDFRQNYNCWISKTLPTNQPFQKLLCFEPFNESNDWFSGIFYSLFTQISTNGRSFTAVTPLLGTGSQGMSKRNVMRAMLTSCIYWMRVGLPLERLHIVLYHSNKTENEQEDNELAIDEFHRFVKIVEEENWFQQLPALLQEVSINNTKKDETTPTTSNESIIVGEFIENLSKRNCVKDEKLVNTNTSVDKIRLFIVPFGLKEKKPIFLNIFSNETILSLKQQIIENFHFENVDGKPTTKINLFWNSKKLKNENETLKSLEINQSDTIVVVWENDSLLPKSPTTTSPKTVSRSNTNESLNHGLNKKQADEEEQFFRVKVQVNIRVNNKSSSKDIKELLINEIANKNIVGTNNRLLKETLTLGEIGTDAGDVLFLE